MVIGLSSLPQRKANEMNHTQMKDMLLERLRWYPFEMDENNRMFTLGQLEMLCRMINMSPDDVPLITVNTPQYPAGDLLDGIDPFDLDAMSDALQKLRISIVDVSTLADEIEANAIETFAFRALVNAN